MNSKIKTIQDEMMARRRELIDLQKERGGIVAIDLKSDNLTFFYNPNRKIFKHNPLGEKFYISGMLRGCPVTINEFEMHELT